MARRKTAGTGEWGHGWVVTIFLLLFFVSGGFAVGLAVGFVAEEPTLVAGHIVGRTTSIDWGPEPGPAGESPASEDQARSSSLASVGAGPSAELLRLRREAPRFSIQVGAFGEAGLAASLAERLRQTGYPVQILEPLEDDRWRVRVGPLADRPEAEGLARRLKLEDRLPTWIVDESGNLE